MALTFCYTLNGIPYRELHAGSGRESFGKNGTDAKITRVYAINWADRIAFRQNIVGDAYQDSGGGVVIIPAHQHPDYNWLYGSNVDFEPLGKPTGENTWQYAKATATYGPLTSNSTTPEDLRQEEYDIAGDAVTLERGNWKVTASGKEVTRDVQKVLPYAHLKITLFKVTDKPSSAVTALYGKLNTATFKGEPANHVLYNGWQGTYKVSNDGQKIWTIVHNFLISPTDLRYQFEEGIMQLIEEKGTGNFKFDTGDFSIIGVG
jgi:hypothetical protein